MRMSSGFLRMGVGAVERVNSAVVPYRSICHAFMVLGVACLAVATFSNDRAVVPNCLGVPMARRILFIMFIIAS